MYEDATVMKPEHKKSNAGRPAYNAILKFKMLVLAALYNPTRPPTGGNARSLSAGQSHRPERAATACFRKADQHGSGYLFEVPSCHGEPKRNFMRVMTCSDNLSVIGT